MICNWRTRLLCVRADARAGMGKQATKQYAGNSRLSGRGLTVCGLNVALSPPSLTKMSSKELALACEPSLLCRCAMTAACYGGGVTSNELVLRRLHSNIGKKRAQLRNKTLTDYFKIVPKYWTSF
jgi:hypothetical protein